MQGVNNKKPECLYAIINVKWNWRKPFTSWRGPFLKKLDYNQLNENKKEALRYNKDKTKAIISMSNMPSFIKEKRILTHDQIIKEIQKEEWK
tara:strand:- start:593 stop:868 length:276 start_codon:yes stop_codon:yes gene_type:complete